MKLPEAVLARVRGPLIAAALAGCSAPSGPEVVPEPAPLEPAPVVVEAPDPVPYDGQAEAERLARVDREDASDGTRRDERVRDEENGRVGLLGTIGRFRPVHPACGRG